MNADELVKLYRRLINKHYAAVQTDSALLQSDDNWKLEKKSKMFWEEFRDLEAQFIAQLQRSRP